jgi:class 3 adenylate cyclase/tetratricopeptide (TPR) repeat protein
MNCPQCGSAYQSDANFCGRCGARLTVVCGLCRTLNEAGHRFCKSCGQSLIAPVSLEFLASETISADGQGSTDASGLQFSGPSPEGEHRQVTVLFCDIVDSTRRAADIGPEAMHLLLNNFFKLGLAEVHRYEGVINNFLGDGFMALFGAPHACEDHARLAVLAAIAIKSRLAVEEHGHDHRLGPLTIRLGVNTGPVVVGRIGDNLHANYTAEGETTHLAFRLQQRADPGEILIADSTKRLVEGYINIEAGPLLQLKHAVQPVATFKVISIGGRRSRIDTLVHPPETTFVGRGTELNALIGALGDAERKKGRVIGVCADAGTGKSRLLFELRQKHVPRRFDYVEAHCASHGRKIPYFAVQDLVRELCGVSSSNTEAVARETLEAVFSRHGREVQEHGPLLLQVLNIAHPNDDPSGPAPARVLSQAVFSAVGEIVLARARNRPLILAIEDVHWIDQLSNDFLAFLVERIARLRVLLIVTYREQYRPDWLHHAYASEIRLEPLSAADAVKIVEGCVIRAQLATSMTKAILDKAAGNPFFLEELTKSILERGGAQKITPIPDTIQDVLMSRIDLLPLNTKRVLQTASVLGPAFRSDLLSAILGEDDRANCSEHLTRLVDAGFLIDNVDAGSSFRFRHALTQEVAYSSLLVSRRQVVHERAGLAMETMHQAAAANAGEVGGLPAAPFNVDLIAYHFSQSTNREKELFYAEKAAEFSVRKGAYSAAYAYVARALELVSALPSSPERNTRELALSLAAGSVLLVLRGQGSVEAREAYDRALGLCGAIGDSPEVGRALFGIWTYFLFHGLMGEAEEAVQKIVRLAGATGDPDIRIMAQLAAAQTYLWMGDWNRCLSHAQAVDALYAPEKHSTFIIQYAQNPRFTAMGCHFWANWALGRSETATNMVSAAIDEARQVNHDFTFVIAYLCKPMLAYYQRRTDDLTDSIGEFVQSAEKAGNPFYSSLAKVLEAAVKAASGRREEGIQQVLEQRRLMQEAGLYLAEPLVVTVLAELLLDAARYEEGLAAIDEAYPVFLANGQRTFLAEMSRLRGELLLARGGDATGARAREIEGCFREALRIASSQSAKALELRAALRLARFLAAAGRREEARELLVPIYFWFNEGLDDPDMVDAGNFLNRELEVGQPAGRREGHGDGSKLLAQSGK